MASRGAVSEGFISPLENAVIVRRILSNFCTEELLELSKVNKLWNFEARCILRDHRTCVAYIGGPRPCVEARSLNSQLESMNTIPFNALSINITNDHAKRCESTSVRVGRLFDQLLQLPLKELQFNWLRANECFAGQLILRRMSKSGTLERLEIKHIPPSAELQDQNLPRDLGLPNLRCLKLPEIQFEEYLFRKQLIQNLMWQPNLQVLENYVKPGQLKLLPPEKFGIVKSIKFDRYSTRRMLVDDEDLLETLEKFCESEPRLKNLRLSELIPRNIVPEERRYFSFLNSVILKGSQNCEFARENCEMRSCESLQTVSLDTWGIENFVTGAGIPLESVTNLHIELPKQESTGIKKCLLPFQLEGIFPWVTEVSFSRGLYHLFRDQMREPAGPNIPWSEVTKIALEDYMLFEPTVKHFGQLFPNLRSLVTPALFHLGEGFPFDLLTATWPSLECIEINHSCEIACQNMNLDAIFCGIYPAEAELLREKGSEFLQKVHIVSPFPAMNHIKGLKKFTMRVQLTPGAGCGAAMSQRKLFLSQLSILLALKRLRNFQLNLNVSAKDAKYFEHLKPFVQLTLLTPKETKISR